MRAQYETPGIRSLYLALCRFCIQSRSFGSSKGSADGSGGLSNRRLFNQISAVSQRAAGALARFKKPSVRIHPCWAAVLCRLVHWQEKVASLRSLHLVKINNWHFKKVQTVKVDIQWTIFFKVNLKEMLITDASTDTFKPVE